MDANHAGDGSGNGTGLGVKEDDLISLRDEECVRRCVEGEIVPPARDAERIGVGHVIGAGSLGRNSESEKKSSGAKDGHGNLWADRFRGTYFFDEFKSAMRKALSLCFLKRIRC
jgi:hypothetical protein